MDYTAIVAGVTGVAAGLFGWLKGKTDEVKTAHTAAIARDNATTAQLEILSKIVESQAAQLQTLGGQITALTEARTKQSTRISAMSAEIDRLKSQLSHNEGELVETRADIKTLQDHVLALQTQVRDLGHEPVEPKRVK